MLLNYSLYLEDFHIARDKSLWWSFDSQLISTAKGFAYWLCPFSKLWYDTYLHSLSTAGFHEKSICPQNNLKQMQNRFIPKRRKRWCKAGGLNMLWTKSIFNACYLKKSFFKEAFPSTSVENFLKDKYHAKLCNTILYYSLRCKFLCSILKSFYNTLSDNYSNQGY